MDFLSSRNVWYQITRIWEFYLLLFLIIIPPQIIEILPFRILNVYQFIWQSNILLLLILFIFLLKFSINVANITILINTDADMGLKRVIRNDIIYQYKKYFEDILNNGFTVEDVNNFYLYLKYDLSQLNEQDVKEFLTIVFNNLNLIDINTNSKVLKKFFLSQKEIDATVILNGVQLFIKEKYKLLTDYTYSEDEAQSIIFPFVEKDMVAYKNLLTDSDEFLNLNSQSYYDNKSTFNLDKMTFNINENQKKVGISATNNIHVYILEKVAPLFKSQKPVESLSSLVNERILNDSYLKENTENHWETDKNNSLPLNFNCSDSNIPINEIVSIQNRITSVSVDVEGFIGFGVYLNGFNTFSEITKFLENNVSKISCLKLTTDDGKEFIVRRNLLREYFEERKFRKDYKFSLAYYLDLKGLTIEQYLDNIEDELKDYDSLKVGIFKKKLIKKEIENIVYDHYY